MCTNCRETTPPEQAQTTEETQEAILEVYCEVCDLTIASLPCPHCSVECQHCGDVSHASETQEIEGRTFCQDCFDELTCLCEQCSTVILNENTNSYMHDGDTYSHVCDNCIDNVSQICEGCGIRYSNEDISQTNDFFALCEDCRRYCDSCDCYVRIENYNHDYNCCDSCWEDREDDDEEDNEDGYRRESDHMDNINLGGILSYGFQPEQLNIAINKNKNILIDPSRTQTRVNNCLFGIELEHTFDNYSIRDLVNKFYSFSTSSTGVKIYYKSDSSINGNGGELVTHPFHENAFNYKQWQEYLTFLTEEANGKAFPVDCNCGIHVHMSWRGKDGRLRHKDPLIVAKLMVFQRLFRENLFKISRRTTRSFDGYSRITDNSTFNTYFGEVHGINRFIKEKRLLTSSDRYSAFSLKDKTLELRLFRSTLNYTSFKCILQMCFNFPNFLEKCSLSSMIYHAERDSLDVFWNQSFMPYMPKNVQDYIKKQLTKK